jgi:hypothetical protein
MDQEELMKRRIGHDMGQEELMKRRMVRALILFGVTFVALLIFIGLYIDEKRRVQETYAAQYKLSLLHASEDIGDYLGGEADYDMRYVRITCDMGCANTFAFLIEDFGDRRKTVNQLYTCLLKYPNQMKTRLTALDAALNDMAADLDKGYEEAAALIESVDKKGT